MVEPGLRRQHAQRQHHDRGGVHRHRPAGQVPPAPPSPEGLLHQVVGQPAQHPDGHHAHRDGRRGEPAQVAAGHDDDREVPQVDRVGPVAHDLHRPQRQPPRHPGVRAAGQRPGEQQQHHERRPLPHVDEGEGEQRLTWAEEVVLDADARQHRRNRTELVVEQEPECQSDGDRCDEHRRQQHRPRQIACPALLLQCERKGEPDDEFQAHRHDDVDRGRGERIPEAGVAERRHEVVRADDGRRAAVGQLVVGDAEVCGVTERETDHPDEEGDEGRDHAVLKSQGGVHGGLRSFRGVVGFRLSGDRGQPWMRSASACAAARASSTLFVPATASLSSVPTAWIISSPLGPWLNGAELASSSSTVR